MLCVAFFVTRRSGIRGRFPGRFSDAEKREISSLVHGDAYRQGVRSLVHGEFRQMWRWLANARRQEVYAVGSQPGGEIWVHVGVQDKSQPEGYYHTARYIMKKENGHWKITRLF